MKNPNELLERQELIQKLIDKGFGKLVDALLVNETSCFTKKGRVNKSGVCRTLGCTPKELETAMREARKLLEDDI